MKKAIHFSFLLVFTISCADQSTSYVKKKEPVSSAKTDSVILFEEEKPDGNSILDDAIMEGYENTTFHVVYDEEGLEILEREVGYQHGHTLMALVMNIYNNEKNVFTDTIAFYADPGEYEGLYLEDGTRILKISGSWANMGSASIQEDFYLIDKNSILRLNPISGYCGGDHYNFDADSTCKSQYSDADNYHHQVFRKKGEKYFTVFKEGYYVESEDACEYGFDTIFVLQKSLINQDSLVLFYSEEKRNGKVKVLYTSSKKQAQARLNTY